MASAGRQSRHAGLKPGNMRPMRNQYRLETPGRASYARISEAAKLAAFDPGKLSPEARQSWERLGHDFKAWHDFDQRHPILRRLALLPLIGGWYRRPAAAMCCGSAAGCWCEGRA